MEIWLVFCGADSSLQETLLVRERWTAGSISHSVQDLEKDFQMRSLAYKDAESFIELFCDGAWLPFADFPVIQFYGRDDFCCAGHCYDVMDICFDRTLESW